MLKKQSALLLAAALALTGCASNGVHWNKFGATAAPLHMNADQGGLVFFRDAADANKTAVNVSIDGEYLASLLPGGSTQVAVCAHPTRITAIQTNKDVGYAMKLAEQGAISPVQAGQITYIQVSSNNNSAPVLTVLDEAAAQAALKNTRLQTHTLPRVEKQVNCRVAAPVVAPAVVPVEETRKLRIRG